MDPKEAGVDLKRCFMSKLVGFAEKSYRDELGKVEALFIQNAAAEKRKTEVAPDADESENDSEADQGLDGSDNEKAQRSDSEDSEVLELEHPDSAPRLERCVEELEEDQVDASFDEVLEDKSIVRTLDCLSVYSKNGRLIVLSKLLENPKALFRNEHMTAFGTLLSPLPEDLRDEDVESPNPSDRELVRQLIVTKEKPKPKATTARAGRSNAASIKLPTYNPDVSRVEAFAEAQKLKDSTELPLQIGTVQVFELGELVTSGANTGQYHTANHLFPVGYRSNRMYTSVQDPTAKVKYTSEILEGPQGPVFRVTHEGGFPIFEAASSSAVWLQVLRAVNEKKVSLGMQAKGTAISGPEMMGFANKRIAAVLEGLDGAIDCEGYVFRAQRQGNVGSGGGAAASGRKRKKSGEKEDGSKGKSRPKSKKSKTKALAGASGSKIQLLSALKQGSAELHVFAKEEAAALLQTLTDLEQYTVDFDALFDTGIGKLINRLRKHHNGDVSAQAKVLKTKWKEVNQGDSAVETSAQERAEIARHAERLASYIGFAGETVPENMTGATAPTAPREQLLRRLKRLDQEIPMVTLDAVVDSLVGKRVNKLRKHLDSAISSVAKRLKSKWKEQIEREGDGSGPAISVSHSPVVHAEAKAQPESAGKGDKMEVDGGGHSSGSESDEKSKKKSKKKKSKKKKHKRRSGDSAHFADMERDFNEDVLIKAYKSRKRQRVCLRDICAISITYGPSHATLWLETKQARYRIAGHRLGLVPSHRYYTAFCHLWDTFQAAALAVLVLKHVGDASSATYDTVLNGILANSVSCPKPGVPPGQEEEGKPQVLEQDRVLACFEAILDQATRTHSSRKRVMKRFINTPFMDNLVNLAKEKHGDDIRKRIEDQRELLRLRTMSEEEKVKEEKRRKEQLQRMVDSGNNLPDDLDVLRDDEAVVEGAEPRFHLPKNECGPRPMPAFFDCDWAEFDIPALAEALGKWFSSSTSSEASAAKPSMYTIQGFPSPEADLRAFAEGRGEQFNERRQRTSANYSSMLSLWLMLRHFRSLLPADATAFLDDFLEFRKAVIVGRVAPVCMALLRLLLFEETGAALNGSSHASTSTGSGVSTRRSGLASKTYTGHGNDDTTPGYVYNRDELWPLPAQLVAPHTWTEVCRRAMLKEIIQEAERVGMREVQRSHGLSARDLRAAPDLLSRCDSLLTSLMENPLATPFCVPVDPINHNAPNYLEIILRPMDLGTVQARLRDGHYDIANRPEGVTYEALSLKTEVNGVEAGEDEEEVGEDEEEGDADVDGDADGMEEEAGGERKKSSKSALIEQKKAERERRKAEELARDEMYYEHDCKGGGHEGFAADVRQVWRNCEKFNNYRTKIYQDAWKLKNQFAKMFQSQVLAFAYAPIPAELNVLKKEDNCVDENAVGQLMIRLRDSPDVTTYPLSLTLNVLHWLMGKVMETSAVRSLITKNAELAKQIEREETKRLQVCLCIIGRLFCD